MEGETVVLCDETVATPEWALFLFDPARAAFVLGPANRWLDALWSTGIPIILGMVNPASVGLSALRNLWEGRMTCGPRSTTGSRLGSILTGQ
jgi:hypothetical protein